MTLDELHAALSKKEGWDAAGPKEDRRLVIPQGRGRKQIVFLSAFSDEGEPMVRFTTRVGPAAELTPQRCKNALEVNARLSHGCLAIESDHLVLTETRPLKTTTPETSARAIRTIARQADTYEKFIYKTDVH